MNRPGLASALSKPVQFSLPACLAGAATLVLMMAFPQAAKADLRICNDTASLIGVALGYRKDGDWVSEGWWQLPGETCASLIEGDLSSRYYYLYAEDGNRGGQWRGEIFMCIAEDEFKIDGVQECFTRGYSRTGFFEVDTNDKESWMVRLSEQGRSGGQQ